MRESAGVIASYEFQPKTGSPWSYNCGDIHIKCPEVSELRALLVTYLSGHTKNR